MKTIYLVDKVLNTENGIQGFETKTFTTLASALKQYYTFKRDLIDVTEYPSFCVGVRTNLGETIEPYEMVACPNYVAPTTEE